MFDWLHHRVPAILTDPNGVQQWLDPELTGEKALQVLKPLTKSQVNSLNRFKMTL